jgi:hypothetical protein
VFPRLELWRHRVEDDLNCSGEEEPEGHRKSREAEPSGSSCDQRALPRGIGQESYMFGPDIPKNSKRRARKSKEERGIVVKSIAPFAPVGRRPATNFLTVFSPTPVHV